MYELYNGSERLMGAIERQIDNPEFMAELAELLYYQPEQLQEDIRALRERLDQSNHE